MDDLQGRTSAIRHRGQRFTFGVRRWKITQTWTGSFLGLLNGHRPNTDIILKQSRIDSMTPQMLQRLTTSSKAGRAKMTLQFATDVSPFVLPEMRFRGEAFAAERTGIGAFPRVASHMICKMVWPGEGFPAKRTLMRSKHHRVGALNSLAVQAVVVAVFAAFAHGFRICWEVREVQNIKISLFNGKFGRWGNYSRGLNMLRRGSLRGGYVKISSRTQEVKHHNKMVRRADIFYGHRRRQRAQGLYAGGEQSAIR